MLKAATRVVLKQLGGEGYQMSSVPSITRFESKGVTVDVGVSKNRGTPKSSHFNRVFHYFHHPFWGFSPYFWKHPCRTPAFQEA